MTCLLNMGGIARHIESIVFLLCLQVTLSLQILLSLTC